MLPRSAYREIERKDPGPEQVGLGYRAVSAVGGDRGRARTEHYDLQLKWSLMKSHGHHPGKPCYRQTGASFLCGSMAHRAKDCTVSRNTGGGGSGSGGQQNQQNPSGRGHFGSERYAAGLRKRVSTARLVVVNKCQAHLSESEQTNYQIHLSSPA
ncbi:hypothetical protein AgCh_006706 [Apium graveolens]